MQIDIAAEQRRLQELAEQGIRDDESAKVDLTPGWSLGVSYVGPQGEREWFGYRGSSWDDLQRWVAIQVRLRREKIEAEKKAFDDSRDGS